MSELHTKHFPNENDSYREARNRLLDEEIALRRNIERVAQMRRDLPLGGKLKEDYAFDEIVNDPSRSDIPVRQKTKLSELFESGKNSLVIYSMMFDPDDETPCASCSSIVDGLDGSAPHIRDRVNFVVVTKAPIEKTLKWAEGRGWHNVRLLSSLSNTYNHDYFGENDKGGQTPILNVFKKSPNGIFHTFATELLFAPSDPGQNNRHVDIIWPVWNMFDFTPEGRGTDWYPKHEYEKS